MTPSAPAPAAGNLPAILIMLVAVGAFSLMDAGLKLLVPHYPPMQIAALRGAASIPFVLAWVLPGARTAALLRVRWGLHAMRGALSITMMSSFVFALDTMPLSTAYAIFFVGPLLVAALSVPLLHTKVGPRTWVAIAIGLVGVLVVLSPSGDGLFSAAGLAMLASATCYAVSAITVRVLSRTDSTEAMVLWMVTALALGAGLLAAPGWVPVQGEHLPLVAGVGLAGAIGQWAITQAFSRGEPSVVAPFEYTALAWSLGLDLALWDVVPGATTWIGAAIIVGGGLVLLKAERGQGRGE